MGQLQGATRSNFAAQCLIADGSPQHVMTPANLQQAYGVSLQQQLDRDNGADLFCLPETFDTYALHATGRLLRVGHFERSLADLSSD